MRRASSTIRTENRKSEALKRSLTCWQKGWTHENRVNQNRKPPSNHAIRSFDLSDLVVFAGPNGIGKTRLVSLLLDKFRNPAAVHAARMVIRATNTDEIGEWGSDTLDLSTPDGAAKLHRTMNRRQRRGKTQSKVLNFDAFWPVSTRPTVKLVLVIC